MVGKKEIILLKPTMNQNEIMLKLENSITYGNSILLENVGE